jgi:hypothetical protein
VNEDHRNAGREGWEGGCAAQQIRAVKICRLQVFVPKSLCSAVLVATKLRTRMSAVTS